MNREPLYYYEITNISTDTIDAIQSTTINAVTAAQISAQWPGWFVVLPDMATGEDTLCASKFAGAPMELSFNSGGPSAYTLTPKLGEGVNVIGPHPTVIFKPGK